MKYKLVLMWIDKAGERAKNVISSSTEFTDNQATTLVSSLSSLTNCKLVGWARIAESDMDEGIPSTGNVDIKVILNGRTATATYKWLFPDPTGNREKPVGSKAEHLTSAAATTLLAPFNTLLGISMTAGESRIIQRV
jgi:hypothetical protein